MLPKIKLFFTQLINELLTRNINLEIQNDMLRILSWGGGIFKISWRGACVNKYKKMSCDSQEWNYYKVLSKLKLNN